MSITTSSAIEELLAAPKFGRGIGFRRMLLLLRPLLESDWGRHFTTIRITGSNGKGTVTAIVHSVLRRLGVHCGRYLSPHLVRFNERIVIDDREITDAEIDNTFAWIKHHINRLQEDLHNDEFGAFELITTLCLKSFFDAGILAGVMEAGIGGRYDPTRLFPGSLVALTSIDLEHADLLGKSKELIAYDKLDLCPDGGTVVGIRRDADLWERLKAYCYVRRLTLVDANTIWKVECLPTDRNQGLEGMDVRITTKNTCLTAKVPLLGTFQLDNIAVGCTLVERWVREFLPDITQETFDEAVVGGLQELKWHGRFERISADPPIFIDVAHSPDACSRLVESINTFLEDRSILLVTGVSANKAVDDILKILVPAAHAVICTRAYHRGERVDRIFTIVRGLAPTKEVWEAATVEEAVLLAKHLAQERRMTVVVAGGLFLAIEFRTAFEGADPKLLRFF